MKSGRKLAKIAEPLTWHRAWRRAQRRIRPMSLARARAGIDQRKLREIQERYARSTAGYSKYADVDRWLRLSRECVQDLQLHRAPPQRVLDLGCGGGFFLLLLQSLGHDALGLDTDRVPLYGELTQLFGVQRIIWRIKPREPLPTFDQQFDWITAFSVAFNVDAGDRPWDVPEWDFFLRDLQRHLALNGGAAWLAPRRRSDRRFSRESPKLMGADHS